MSASSTRLAVLCQLVVSAMFVFRTVSALPLRHDTWRATLAISGALILAAAGLTAIIGFLVRRISRTKTGTDWRILGLVCWLVPLALSVRLRSPFLVLAAGVVGIGILRLFAERPREAFFLAFLAALALQTGVVAWETNSFAWAAVLFSVAAAIVAWRLEPRVLSHHRRRAIVSFSAALLLSAALLAPYIRSRFASEEGDQRAAAPPSRQARRAETVPASGTGSGGDYDGVIMWPEEQPRTLLIPPLPAMRPNLFQKGDSHPLSIPFYGVYWFYKRPYLRPPGHSLITRGTPVKQTFRSTDFMPLLMEAHQNFGKRIELRCCSAIQLAVTSADQYPGSIAIELTLLDSNAHRSLQLGTASVTSMSAGAPGAGEQFNSELLTYPIPPRPPIQAFDEVSIRYHLSSTRWARSAKVAIDRFVLLPRGL